MRKKGIGIALATVWLSLGIAWAPAFGDGGTLRFSGRRGDQSITVFTAPALLSAGPVDLSVLVLDVETGRPITDLPIEVRARRVGSEAFGIRMPATSEAATNKLLQAARLELSEPGLWQIEVSVGDFDPSQPVAFDVELAPPPPRWRQMIPWIAWPILPIGLYAITQLRPRRAWRGRAV